VCQIPAGCAEPNRVRSSLRSGHASVGGEQSQIDAANTLGHRTNQPVEVGGALLNCLPCRGIRRLGGAPDVLCRRDQGG
jgi:hypothetical protein